jgi:hypothetical protein
MFFGNVLPELHLLELNKQISFVSFLIYIMKAGRKEVKRDLVPALIIGK